MKQVFFVGDTSNRGNWGCRATTLKLRELVQGVAEVRYAFDTSRPHMELTARLPYQPEKAVSLRRKNPLKDRAKLALRKIIDPRMLRSSPRALQHRLGLLEYAEFADFQQIAALMRGRHILANIANAIDGSDVVFINGEGSVMQNRLSGRLKLLIAYAAKAEFGKAVVIANHSADIRHPAFSKIAQAIYPLVDDALFREQYSLEATGQLRAGKPHAFAADAAFRFEPLDRDTLIRVSGRTDYCTIWPDDARSFDPAKPYICVGGSSVYLGRSESFSRLRAEYTELCQQLQRLAPVVLTASSQPDDVLLRPIAAQLNLPFFGLSTPVQQAVDLLGNAAAYVGGRWHPGILALTGGTPIVSLSANTDYKSNGLTHMAGLTQPPIPAMDVKKNTPMLLELTSTYIRDVTLRSKLLGTAARLRLSALDNVRYLSI